MVEQLDEEEFRTELDSEEPLQIIDVRPPSEFEAGHVPGAQNIPFASLTDRVETVDWGRRIALVCDHGTSSYQAGLLLEAYEGVENDARIMNLTTGYDGWTGDLETSTDSSAARR